jgi:3-oxoadipate enol-lactonase
MPSFTVGDASLYYQEYGAGDPLVFAHGFTSAGDTWIDTVPAFSDHYRVIVPDLRGHGRSTGARDTISFVRFGTDLAALLDHLGVEHAHLVGHSAGGFAVPVPRDAAARPRPDPDGHRRDARLGRASRQRLRDLATDKKADSGWTAEQVRRHGSTHGEDHGRVLLDMLFAMAADPEALPFQPMDLAAITRPTLVVHGDRDWLYPIEHAVALYRTIPQAELAVVPDSDHGPNSQHPDIFVRLLVDFLSRHAAD